MNREEQKQTIKDYLKRLGAGEELESVRVDFVKKFQSVDAAEIMNAEQELIKEGTPISEVQRLCDVHSALFHGKTREEQIANAPNYPCPFPYQLCFYIFLFSIMMLEYVSLQDQLSF